MSRAACTVCRNRLNSLILNRLKLLNENQYRHRRSCLVINPKKLKAQVEKFMVRNAKLRNRFVDTTENIASPHVSLLPTDKQLQKTLPKDITIRERNVSSLIKNEIESVINSGLAGEELRDLEITFTKAAMTSPNTCKILWEPYFSAKDLEVSGALNRASKKIRHVLMTSHVMNNVPNLYFYIDANVLRNAQVEKIFQEQDIDMGPPEEWNQTSQTIAAEHDQEKVCLFDLDYDAIHSKLTHLKKTNKVDKG